MKDEYEVKLDIFEGPLDLLLYLVNRAEVAITEISVAEITQQYLEYLDVMKECNIDIAAEYMHMAATLIRLKARELLPSAPEAEQLEDETGIYNREQLIAQLLEYKKYKEAAQSLRSYESHLIGTATRSHNEEIELGDNDESIFLGDINIYDLLSAFKNILERGEAEQPVHAVRADMVKVDDRIEHIIGLLSGKKEVPFEQLFTDDRRRIVLTVTFMAVLELVKMREILFRQESTFGMIYVRRRNKGGHSSA
jgi:segregation and condensation protein A